MSQTQPKMESENGLNLVTIIIDTLRYDHVSANPGSDPTIETPNLDRLAERSWRFTNAYAASFATIACRNDIMTGRYGGPFNQWAPLRYDIPTLPGELARAGYITQLIHDTPHLVNGGHRFDVPFHGWTFTRGAEVDRPWVTDSWEWLENWAFDDRFDAYPMDEHQVYRDDHTLPLYADANRGRESQEDWNVARLFQTASAFLEDNADRENFFLWIDCFDPHEPWDAPPEFVRRYDAQNDGYLDPRSFRTEVRNDPKMSDEIAAHLDAQYKAKVSFMDRWFGIFLDTLEETGLADNTAVLVMGDHGTNLDDAPERLFGKESPPAQNEAHVPLFLMVPDSGSGQCDALVQPQDVFATMASFGGATIPSEVGSYNLLDIAQEGENPRSVALCGTSADNWQDASSDDVLFHAFDGEWSLGVTRDPEEARLCRLGNYEDLAFENPETMDRLYNAAIDEVGRRDTDPALTEWLLKSDKPFPEDAQLTSFTVRPDGWEMYWSKDFYR